MVRPNRSFEKNAPVVATEVSKLSMLVLWLVALCLKVVSRQPALLISPNNSWLQWNVFSFFGKPFVPLWVLVVEVPREIGLLMIEGGGEMEVAGGGADDGMAFEDDADDRTTLEAMKPARGEGQKGTSRGSFGNLLRGSRGPPIKRELDDDGVDLGGEKGAKGGKGHTPSTRGRPRVRSGSEGTGRGRGARQSSTPAGKALAGAGGLPRRGRGRSPGEDSEGL